MSSPNPAPINTAAQAVPLRQLKDLPGPTALPWVGNAFQIKPAQLHRAMEKFAKEYGPYYVVRLGRMSALAVSDHAVVSQILRDRPERFQRSQRLNDVLTELGLPLGLFNAEGEAWRQQRRMVMASFSPAQIRAYFPAMLGVTERLQKRWYQACAQGSWIDLQADLMRYTVDTITGLAFGQESNTLEAQGSIIQTHLDKIFPATFKRILSLIPYWRFVKLPADRQLDRSALEVKAAITDFIAHARERLRLDPARRENPPNLLEAFIVAAEQDDSKLTDEAITGNVLTMLLAGEDTTANTLAWMIDLLYHHPQALQRAQDEVRRAARSTADFTPELLGQLDYLDACAHETMRLKPVAPFLPVEAVHDTVIGDIEVPAGTVVWNILRHDSVSEQYFADPLSFKPERWLAQSPAAKGIAMPFGGGPRICPGRYLALLEMKMAMAMLLLSFDIAQLRTPKGGPAEEIMSFTMQPVGLEMQLKRAALPT